MHKQRLLTRAALMSILLIAAVALSACANASLPAAIRGVPTAGETAAAPSETTTPAPVPTAGNPAPVDAARRALAHDLGIQLEDIRVVSVGEVEWPNGCLGIDTKGVMCTEAIVPGYQIILEANGKEYEYRSDLSGRQIAAAPAVSGGAVTPGEVPTVQAVEQPADTTVIALRRDVDGCSDVRIDLNGVTFGACGEEMAAGQFLADTNRLEQLADLQRAYASFNASTPAGKVKFTGTGPTDATPVEQRMIAEWANLVVQEVRVGPGGAQYGLGWRREGGIAGFCDDIAVEVSGHATWRSCRQDSETASSWRRLTAGDLAKLYGWLDQVGQVESEQKDPAVADAMTIRAFFSGRGTGQASDADKTTLLQFGAELLQQWAEATPVRLIDTLAEVNIRKGPSEEFEVIEKVDAGRQELVTGVNRDSTWWRVICPDSTVGNCWVSADATLTHPIAPTGSTGEEPIDESGVLAAVIRQVFTVDDTYGGKGDFATVYLLAVDDTESGAIPYSSSARTVTAPVQQGTVAALADLSTRFEWIATAGEAPRDKNDMVEGNGAIITVGNVRPRPDGTVQVAASIYVGMLAAGGQTYVLEQQDGVWEVTGTTGAVWIS